MLAAAPERRRRCRDLRRAVRRDRVLERCGGPARAWARSCSSSAPRCCRRDSSRRSRRWSGSALERVRKLTGRLARENAVRNPGRTATTAAALMIGLALVTFVAVFAAGIKASIDDAIDKSFTGDLTLQHEDGFSPIPRRRRARGRADRRRRPGLVAALRRGRGGARPATRASSPRWTPRRRATVFEFDWEEGSDATVDGDDPRRRARRPGLGDRQRRRRRRHALRDDRRPSRNAVYTVRGKLNDTADLWGDFVLTHEALDEDFRRAPGRDDPASTTRRAQTPTPCGRRSRR